LDQKINKSVFITGASGFLASYVIPELLNKNYRVYATDIKGYDFSIVNSNDNNLFFVKKEFKKAVKDFKKLFKQNKETASSILHFAGISETNISESDHFSLYDANVNLTVEVLEFCIEQNIPKIFFPSTALVYGENKINQSSSEESLVNPLNFYAWTKYITEKIIESYCANFRLKASVMRFNCIIGFPLKIGTILNDIYRQISEDTKEVIIKNGNPVRDYIFVKDAVSALISILNKNSNSKFEIYNVSSGKGLSSMELARIVCASNNLPVSIVKSRKPSEEKPPYLVLDNTKIKKLGWYPKYSAKESVRQINKDVVQ